MNIIIITKIKYKKEKTKTENILITHGYKKINNNTYKGKTTKQNLEQIIKELKNNTQQHDNIIIIPLCKKCYNNITQIGTKINLEEEQYVIL